MPKPFKNLFNADLIAGMGDHLSRHWPAFDRPGFNSACLQGLKTLALKGRSRQILQALIDFLPQPFETTAPILLATLHPNMDAEVSTACLDDTGIAGWAILPMSQYVAERGQDHFELSMHLLKEMTKRFSSEFAIRNFLTSAPQQTLEVLHEWAKDDNHHVRRLVSEGTRPRLPWAKHLTDFIKDPTPILPLLEILKDDPEIYVRRSVANNLNDISKNHPELVVEITNRWLPNATLERKKLLRHACRSLIKAGDQSCLELLGYQAPQVRLEQFNIVTPEVYLGESLQFELCFTSTNLQPQNLILDYIIHHVKANGSTTTKLFKWKTIKLAAGKSHRSQRFHKIKPITTRTYYPGQHGVEIMLNGKSLARADFMLIIA